MLVVIQKALDQVLVRLATHKGLDIGVREHHELLGDTFSLLPLTSDSILLLCILAHVLP